MNHNTAAYGLIIASLLIAASFLAQISQGPFIIGIPLFAFILFIIAGVMGYKFLTSTLREHH